MNKRMDIVLFGYVVGTYTSWDTASDWGDTIFYSVELNDLGRRLFPELGKKCDCFVFYLGSGNYSYFKAIENGEEEEVPNSIAFEALSKPYEIAAFRLSAPQPS